MTDAPLTYVYCLARAAHPPRIERVRGVADTAAPRALDAGGLWLLVASARRARYGGDALAAALRDVPWVTAAALAHDRVVGRWLGTDAVVPLRPFTLFADDARAMAWARRRRRALERHLDRVAGCVELGVRVAVTGVGRAASAAPARSSSGTAFLRDKQRAHDAARLQLARSRRGGRSRLRRARRPRAQRRRAAARRRQPVARRRVPRSRASAAAVPHAAGRADARRARRRRAHHRHRPVAAVQLRPGGGMSRRERHLRRPSRGVVLGGADASLLDLLDNLLERGVVLDGEAVIGVADVDPIYLRLTALLCAADRAPARSRR